MRYLLVGLLGLGLVLSLGAAVPSVPLAAPLAQATATPTSTPTVTPTPTATLPPVQSYGDGWGVQPLPRAGVNCFVLVESGSEAGSTVNCVSGTPIPAP